MEALGLKLEEGAFLSDAAEQELSFLDADEEVTCQGKMWHFFSGQGFNTGWKPGHLVLTTKRLCWWYDFEQKIAFETPVDRIVGPVLEVRDLSAVLTRREVLDVVCGTDGNKEVVSFSGPRLGEWHNALKRIVAGRAAMAASDGSVETCPQCGQEALASTLLEKGCSTCGWVSPRLRRRGAQATAVPA